MRITIRNKNTCLICNRQIICFEGYKCSNCNNNFHKRCILDTNPLNNINTINCIICERYINFQRGISYDLTYDIIKCVICEFIYGTLCIGVIIGIVVYFTVPNE